MKESVRNVVFLCIISIFILIFMGGIPFRGIKNISITENRALATFPCFNMSNFMNGSYQDELESALSDQVIFSQSFKTNYNRLKSLTLDFTLDFLNNKKIEFLQTPATLAVPTESARESNHTSIEPSKIHVPPPIQLSLTPRGNDLMELDDYHHLVFPPRTTEMANPLFTSKTNNYNELVSSYPNIHFYSYYIETDADIDFIHGKFNHELSKFLASKLDKRITSDYLKVNTALDYKQYFFKTDHHWSLPGQLQGYKDMVTLLKGPNESLLNFQKVDLPEIKYYGYKSRILEDFSIYDKFGFWKTSLPEHKEYINGMELHYGNQEEYEKGNYSLEEGANHYGACYGYDFGVVEYDFPGTENLLLFVESFSNPINAFIASHFNHTYVVDLRYYERDYKIDFDFSDFIKDKDINKVLFTGYYYFYANDEFLIQP